MILDKNGNEVIIDDKISIADFLTMCTHEKSTEGKFGYGDTKAERLMNIYGYLNGRGYILIKDTNADCTREDVSIDDFYKAVCSEEVLETLELYKTAHITDCKFYNCALNSGSGGCVSTNMKKCESIPTHFDENYN